MKCSNCGKEIANDSAFCEFCGTPVSQKEEKKDNTKVEAYLMQNKDNLPENQLPSIREKLLSLDEDKFNIVTSVPLKNPTTALILSILVGFLGIDRFYIGHTKVGILKLVVILLVTIFSMGIGTLLEIIDWFLIKKATREVNASLLQQAIEQ